MDKPAVQARARQLGLDLLGVAAVAPLEAALPPDQRPSALSGLVRSVLVGVRRNYRGMIWADHVPTKHFWAGRILKEFEEQLGDLAAAIEAEGAAALLVPAMAMDYERRTPIDLTPAGQGTYLARVAAVQAGLGTLGLNEMLLTQRFGPRCFVGVVLTDLDLPPDEPLAAELCLGLEACGRCAAICPEQAIPLRAPTGADLAAVRGLDHAACARSSQPYGPATMARHLSAALDATAAQERWRLVKDLTTGELWQQVTMHKEGGFTACQACEDVCPVGDDYAATRQSPHRQADLPEGVQQRHDDGWVAIQWVGPRWRWPAPPPEREGLPPLEWMESRR
jgi:epoxyqueuosine reductase